VLAEARKDAESEVANLKRDWERQRREAAESLQEEVVETSLDITRHLLMKLAGTDVEDRLREWRQTEVDRYLAEQGVADGTPVRVVTAKPLPEEEQHRLTEKLSNGEEQREIRFETDEALIAGARIEFSAAAVDASLAGILAGIRSEANEKPKTDDKEEDAT
jgi:F0F1-type ATP synthase delta subunit